MVACLAMEAWKLPNTGRKTILRLWRVRTPSTRTVLSMTRSFPTHFWRRTHNPSVLIKSTSTVCRKPQMVALWLNKPTRATCRIRLSASKLIPRELSTTVNCIPAPAMHPQVSTPRALTRCQPTLRGSPTANWWALWAITRVKWAPCPRID